MSAAAARQLRVAVAGGSLGGLTAALWLAEAGGDVHVYERSASPLDSRGAGIVVQPDTVRYLQTHGTATETISTSTSGRAYLTPDGRVSQRMAGQQRFTSWNTLYRHLLGCLDPGRYHLGAAVTGVRQDTDGVTVEFADGSSREVDLLVAADGPRSALREQLLPGIAPAYAGYVAWRGLVPESALTGPVGQALADTFLFAELPGSHALCYPIPGPAGQLERGQRLLNWLWYRTVPAGPALDELLTDRTGRLRTSSIPPGQIHPTQAALLRQAAAEQLPRPFQALVEATEELFLQPVVDLSVSRMAFGRIALLGDAAFVPRPHTAGSTMKAAHNGQALAAAVTRADGDVPTALRGWESGQLQLGRQLEHSGQALAASSGLGR